MCNNCNNNACSGCNQQCYQFPPPPGPPGQVGPMGPQGAQGATGPGGSAPVFKIVNFATNLTLPATVYTVDGSEDVVLVDTTIAQLGGTADIILLPANDPLAALRVLRIVDAFGQSGIHDIRLIPNGTDTINGVNAPISLFNTFNTFGSANLVTNKTNGYNFV